MTKSLVIGDVHFGCRSNNIVWLEQQLLFFENQIIPILKSDKIDNVIFLGDVFDVRYSINQKIGIDVKNLFRKLCSYNKDIYILAGNHDYYSPLIEFQGYNAYELIFGKEFLECHKNLHYVTEAPVRIDDSLILPWYFTEEVELWQSVIHDNKGISTIYCHSDLTSWDDGRLAAIHGVTVYSGHIHYAWKDSSRKLYNIGACCAFNFNDVNQKRFVYIIEDGKITDAIENITTPRFKRFYNEDIFNLKDSDFDNSIVQLCISQSNINKAKYIEHIKDLKNKYVNSNVKVNIIDDSVIEKLNTDSFDTNIDKYIEQNMPIHLTEKYENVKHKKEENKK